MEKQISEQNKQEYLLKLSLLEQQSQQIEQQLQAIEQQITELEILKVNLDGIWEKRGKEVLTPVSGGIFLKSELKKQDFIVEVGSKILVKKDLEGTKKIVEKSIFRLRGYQRRLLEEITKINEELQMIANNKN